MSCTQLLGQHAQRSGTLQELGNRLQQRGRAGENWWSVTLAWGTEGEKRKKRGALSAYIPGWCREHRRLTGGTKLEMVRLLTLSSSAVWLMSLFYSLLCMHFPPPKPTSEENLRWICLVLTTQRKQRADISHKIQTNKRLGQTAELRVDLSGQKAYLSRLKPWVQSSTV